MAAQTGSTYISGTVIHSVCISIIQTFLILQLLRCMWLYLTLRSPFSTRLSKQELIRYEIANTTSFYDDMVHVQASAYAHWTNFLISTIHLRYLCTYLPIKPSFNVDSPVQPVVLRNGPAHWYTRNSSGDMGVGNYSPKWRPCHCSSCFAKIIAE